MSAAASHICIPQCETIDWLVSGVRSSVKETCATCRKTSTWIARADGQIVSLSVTRERSR